MKKDYLIFDFDGTVADTFEAILKVVKSISKDYGMEKITDEDIKKFKEKGMRQLIKDLKISLVKMATINRRIKAIINKDIASLKSFPGLKEAFLELKKRGYSIGILTSNSKGNVEKFLKSNDLGFFEFIYSDSSLFGKDKVLKKLLREHNIKSNRVVYFGDEIRDIQAALKLNIKIVAVSWGFNSKKALEKYKPTYLLEKPSEILTLFS